MTDLYLICHKVRGEAAFDVASKLQIGDEVGWVIPTSGHRAYPFWRESLSFVLQEALASWEDVVLEKITETMPEGLRDHYSVEAPPKAPINLAELDL